MIVSEEIKRLHELHQAGALTDEEFARAKARLLDSDPGQGGAPFSSGPAPHADADAGADFARDVNRFRRSRNDRWLGGVCGGLGLSSGMESWIWRLIFVLFTLSFGFGLVIYLLLWIFVPDEDMIGN
ncbi:PspC domain-containing protein [Rugamonas sp.]|uniref:PspC domain-containing protein n=1 Tax=Rugamonas sp. TaxID=1926287 RepID=UPI0025FD5D2E|nr:PspC domain-containing protein [Rugamonas sp.]